MTRGIDSPDGGSGLSHLLRIAKRGILLGLHVARPGRVVVVHADGAVDVEPAFLTVVRGNTPATSAIETTLPPQPLQRVPVVFPRGASGGISFGLVVGDTGLLLYTDRSLERWKTLGIAIDPQDARAHSPADAVFVPGLRSLANPITGTPALPTDTVVEGPRILLGRAATLGVARLNDGVRSSEALAAWASSVEAALVAAGAAVPASFAALGLTAPGALGTISSASTKTLAE